jgi:outer membrane receptor protein involved in Fe transport
MVSTSGAFARGNENNAHQPDGTNYLGSGQSVGYAIFNLSANLRVTPQWQLKAQVNNLFDTSYGTVAQLSPTGFDANGNFVARALGGSSAKGYPAPQSTFYAPGAPRMTGSACATRLTNLTDQKSPALLQPSVNRVSADI